MKRTMLSVLVGTSCLIPMESEAQRTQPRTSPSYAPSSRVTAAPQNARLADCRPPRNGQAYTCRAEPRDRVVYRYASNPRSRLRRDWIPARWGGIHMVPLGSRDLRGSIGQGRLTRMLGHRTVRRLRNAGWDAGLRGALRGHWFESRRDGAVLTVSMGHVDIARLFDFDRDGLVDSVRLLNTRRW